MKQRSQQTIARAAVVAGVGFLTGADIRLRFLPAAAGHGVAFLRTDKLCAPPIPALVSYTIPRARRTAIARCGIVVEMVEHVLAALAGLRIDNCLVELDGPEPPGCDGSSQAFVESLLDAGIVDLGTSRDRLELRQKVVVQGEEADQTVCGSPADDGQLHIRYSLDYGADSPIQSQNYEVAVTPQNFIDQIAFARTFLLEHEAHALRSQGYGKRTTPRDLLIFGKEGVIDNALRCPDECARHKILDCIGDLALAGCDLSGAVDARRSGHQLNAEFVRRVKLAHAETVWPGVSLKAA
ncbi:MAG: UDP-3-O-acyl-N-acetylglucosamine deacetylase [Planctomycetia bacterium]|nr:UDP-3-O-acyl-N-acetylglucosamine deacetylase [Planctomycetia bacterium]